MSKPVDRSDTSNHTGDPDSKDTVSSATLVRRRRMSARREAAKASTRAALVEAAREAFLESGLDIPSLDAICDRAGYTRGAYYVHFQSRESLVIAVCENILQSLGELGTSSESSNNTAKSLIDRLLLEYPTYIPAHQFLHACGRSANLRQLYVGTLTELAGRLSNALKASGADGDAPDNSAAWLVIALATGAQALKEIGAPINQAETSALIQQLLQRS